jgi:hypothetical protein
VVWQHNYHFFEGITVAVAVAVKKKMLYGGAISLKLSSCSNEIESQNPN